jgi:hypothetical protein
MAIKIKPGVTPPNLILMAALANSFRPLQAGMPADLVITAGTNGRHTTGSAHYDGAALDVRSKTFDPVAKLPFVQKVIGRLGTPVAVDTPSGPGYLTQGGKWLGILESEGQAQEHFHFELN